MTTDDEVVVCAAMRSHEALKRTNMPLAGRISADVLLLDVTDMCTGVLRARVRCGYQGDRGIALP